MLKNMKNKVTDFVVGEFVDYKGLTHKVVVAAISEVLEYTAEETDDNPQKQFEVVQYDSWDGSDYENGPLRKSLRIGATVCNPEDTFDEAVGVKKALGRASASKPILYSTKLGVINTKVVKALLEQELNYYCSNPELLIPGYRDSEKRYLYNKEMQEKINNLSPEEKKVYDFLAGTSDEKIDSVLDLVEYTLRRQ